MHKTRAPSIPTVLVELGRAVELDSTGWTWTWNKRDNWVVCATTNGKQLYLFKRPKKINAVEVNRRTKPIKRGDQLYKVFNHLKSDEYLKGTVTELKRKEGRAIHIVYHSNKFGVPKNYIHVFKTPPIVWLDKPNLPKIVALTGGDIRITKRGIVG